MTSVFAFRFDLFFVTKIDIAAFSALRSPSAVLSSFAALFPVQLIPN